MISVQPLRGVLRLTAYLRQRAYVWNWRLRYWWLDTEAGMRTRTAIWILATFALIADALVMAVRSYLFLKSGG